MVAEGGNGQGVFGVIPDGPKTSKVCLMIARVFANGKDSTSLSSIIAGERIKETRCNMFFLDIIHDKITHHFGFSFCSSMIYS
jgi:hypothetical protein